jgi:stage V sporulation protein AD
MKRTHIFDRPPGVISSAAVGGKMEADGPMGKYFDKINEEPYLATDSFE